ncbi:hypothetical protein GUITHDRAFT_122715, partial [Guillardia theta CCMP2712]
MRGYDGRSGQRPGGGGGGGGGAAAAAASGGGSDVGRLGEGGEDGELKSSSLKRRLFGLPTYKSEQELSSSTASWAHGGISGLSETGVAERGRWEGVRPSSSLSFAPSEESRISGMGGKELRRSMEVRDRLLEAEGRVNQLAREKKELEKALEQATKDLEGSRRARSEAARHMSEKIATLESHVDKLVRENEVLRVHAASKDELEASWNAKVTMQDRDIDDLSQELRRERVQKSKFEESKLAMQQLQAENEALRHEVRRLEEAARKEADRMVEAAVEGLRAELIRCKEERQYFEQQTDELRSLLAARSRSVEAPAVQQETPEDYENLKRARRQLGDLVEQLQLELKRRE